MDLSITIASYNSCQVTRQALESIQKETHGIDYEIIVVDNASTDNTVDMIAAEFPQVRLIRNDRNLGFAAAHNRGLAGARGKFLLILNSDVVFVDNAAGRLITQLRAARPEVGIIGPQIIRPDGTLEASSRRRILYSRWMVMLSAINQSFHFGRFLPMSFVRRHLGRFLGRVHDSFMPPTHAQEVEWLDGMCVMFRREVLEQTGLFDEQYFFDYEIGDLLIRACARGWRILFDPTITIIHLGGYSRRLAPKIMIESRRSQLTYYAKYRPDYVPMLCWMHLFLCGLKIKFMQGIHRLSAKSDDEWSEKMGILKDIYKTIADFNPASVSKRERIPILGRSDLATPVAFEEVA